mmetsp:Transcript_10489/g.15584  ORF Transcript_10489/g.15584 Transcript_10489/m.15584 type:complete len:278 (-) Transcript_10489:4-837(-)
MSPRDAQEPRKTQLDKNLEKPSSTAEIKTTENVDKTEILTKLATTGNTVATTDYNLATTTTSPYNNPMYGGGMYGGMGMSPYGMMGMGMMGMGGLATNNPITNLLFSFQQVIFTVTQTIQVVGMNAESLKLMMHNAKEMAMKAQISITDTMRQIDAHIAANERMAARETREQKKKRRRLKALRWSMVMVAAYAAYKLFLKRLIFGRRRRRGIMNGGAMLGGAGVDAGLGGMGMMSMYNNNYGYGNGSMYGGGGYGASSPYGGGGYGYGGGAYGGGYY